MSYSAQQPTYYYDPNQNYYNQSSQAGPFYGPNHAFSDASMNRGYSTQSSTSHSSGTSASSPDCYGPYHSPRQLPYSPTYPDSYDSTQQYPITAPYPSQRQKPSRAEAKPTKISKSYPCLHPGCTSRAQFTRAADLERHHKTVHFVEKKLDCPERWCGRVGEYGFTRRDHLIEHQRTFHMQDLPKKKPRHS